MAFERSRPHRVAIYYAPATGSAWWQAGSGWLGRCAASRQPLEQPRLRHLTPQAFCALTAEPRRYGWHATLKAPFALAPGEDLASLRRALQPICRAHAPLDLSTLQVTRMGGFLALRPAHAQRALEALGTDCVQRLQPLAAPLGVAELARRRRAGLSAEQDELLLRWGYPWVLQHFRFHLTLTGPLGTLAPEALEDLLEAAARQFHALPPCELDRLSVFVEPEPGADFELHEQLMLFQ